MREWGRIGTQGRHRIELLEDAGRAADAMVAVYRAKQKRGYQLAG
ncbi:MAG: WGR domain-containing protein [Pseudomonadota bacterium]